MCRQDKTNDTARRTGTDGWAYGIWYRYDRWMDESEMEGGAAEAMSRCKGKSENIDDKRQRGKRVLSIT